jgi:amino acid transporter
MGDDKRNLKVMDYSPEPSHELPEYSQTLSSSRPWKTRILDSFQRDRNAHATPKGVLGSDGRVFDVEDANTSVASSPLQRRLKGRHLQMIAIGGSIGTGLFVGSGQALANGGPASVLIAFGLVGLMMYTTVHALGEMAVLYPVAGSFSAYSTRFLDPAWGFAMGWK